MRRTGLPARDLRILDPLLSYPSTILGRERAIVINLEHIKAIITAHELLLLNARDPSVSPFVEELHRRISRHYHASNSQETGIGVDNVDWGNLYAMEGSQSRRISRSSYSGSFNGKGNEEDEEDNRKQQDQENRDGLNLLPFEFVALEACIEATCSCLDSEARTLEQEAYPALDKLTSMISTLNLERVRQIKSRLVAITGRVQKIRDELEQLLDDDEDMAEMYLSDKLLQLESSSVSSVNEQDNMEMDDEVMPSDMNDRNCAERGNTIRRESNASHKTRSATSNRLSEEELEMLLEAYFVQIDGTLNKLSTLREYVDDTEDYINIMLDDKQNQLLQMGVMLTAATLVVSCFIVVVGIMGMNIKIELFNPNIAGMPEFLWTIGGASTGCIFLYVFAIAWCKHKRLLD